MAEDLGFEKRPVDCCGRAGVPLELKLLGVLRLLGRGTCFDGIEELTMGSAEVHRAQYSSMKLTSDLLSVTMKSMFMPLVRRKRSARPWQSTKEWV